MKKILLYAGGLLLAWIVIQAIINDPGGSANKASDAAESTGGILNSLTAFFTSLSGPALLAIVIIGVAIFLAKRR